MLDSTWAIDKKQWKMAAQLGALFAYGRLESAYSMDGMLKAFLGFTFMSESVKRCLFVWG